MDARPCRRGGGPFLRPLSVAVVVSLLVVDDVVDVNAPCFRARRDAMALLRSSVAGIDGLEGWSLDSSLVLFVWASFDGRCLDELTSGSMSWSGRIWSSVLLLDGDGIALSLVLSGADSFCAVFLVWESAG